MKKALNTILVADDETSMVEMLEIMLEGEGYRIHKASSTEEAEKILDSKGIDLVISDMKMPSSGGIGVLKASLRRERTRPVIMITAYASAESAVEAMKLGAADYITKPFNLEEMKIIVKNALERRRLEVENSALKSQLKRKTGIQEIIGHSKEIQAVKEMIMRVAESNATVLITGESGTGKELIASGIHAHSPRSGKPFLSINCGAMPEQLLESELFGHAKGAFTGAATEKTGLLEAADGGSFFLDEITEMPLSLQVKLVRAIQEKEIRRVGDIRNIRLNIRFIAATNRDPEEAIQEGKFREDLFYRLNVVHIKAPPLRDRVEDIPLLAKYFLDRFNAMNNRKIRGFTPEAMKILEEYSWRGNVRELENVVERTVVLETADLINPENLPEHIRFPSFDTNRVQIPDSGVDLEKQLTEMEKKMIAKALEQTSGSKKKAAKLLNMNLRSLRYKLSKYGISR
jgi:two-component system response regulator PilR (NtrC family)